MKKALSFTVLMVVLALLAGFLPSEHVPGAEKGKLLLDTFTAKTTLLVYNGFWIFEETAPIGFVSEGRSISIEGCMYDINRQILWGKHGGGWVMLAWGKNVMVEKTSRLRSCDMGPFEPIPSLST